MQQVGRAVVGDVHPRFALAPGRGDGAVGVDDGLSEELAFLLFPDLEARLVDDLHEQQHLRVVLEAAAEVAGRGRIGNSLGAQGIQRGLVGAEEFEVFDAGSAGQDVVGQAQHVVAFMVGQVLLEQMKVLVDGLRQADVVGQQVGDADAATGDGVVAVGQVVVDVLGREHGPGLVFPVPSGQTFFDSAFASGQLLVCSVVHSKRLLAYEGVGTSYSFFIHENRGVSSAFIEIPTDSTEITLV